MKTKRSVMFWVGIIIIALTALMLLMIPLWKFYWRGNVDFPCEWFGGPGSIMGKVGPDTRISYCISVYPRDASGGYPLFGSTQNDNLKVVDYGFLEFSRSGDSLIYNGRVLNVGEEDTKHLISLALNPWLLATADLTIKNESVLHTVNIENGPIQCDILIVSGNVIEGWRYSPLGFVFLAIGFGLIFANTVLKKRKGKPNSIT